MTKRWMFGLSLLFVLGAAPLQVAAEGTALPVSGEVTEVQPLARTLRLGGQTFQVPQGVEGFEGLEPGMSVLLRFESVGGNSVVTQIETAEPD